MKEHHIYENNLPKIIAGNLTTVDITVYGINKTSHNYFTLQIYQGYLQLLPRDSIKALLTPITIVRVPPCLDSIRVSQFLGWLGFMKLSTLFDFHRVISSISKMQSMNTWTESRKSETVSPMCTCWQITIDKKLLGEALWWVFWGWSVVFSNFEIGNTAQNFPYISSIERALDTC